PMRCSEKLSSRPSPMDRVRIVRCSARASALLQQAGFVIKDGKRMTPQGEPIPRGYAEGHDGHRRLVLEEIVPPAYQEIRQVGATTEESRFAIRGNPQN